MITFQRVLGVLTLASLVACGGGGGGGGGGVSGGFDGYRIPIAAGTGAALAGASVTVDDSGVSKTFTCSGNTDENGYITCDVPASYTPPLVITVKPADASANTIKTIVLSANKGTNPSVPATPLTNLLIQADWDFYQKANPDQAKVRLTARKKQISDALADVFTKILGTDKAKNFDFLTDSSFVPGSNDGSDLLLDNISVDIQSFKVSLKNGSGSDSSVSFDPKSDPATNVQPITVAQTDVVLPTTRLLKDFAGVYDIDVTFTSYNADGTVSAQTKTLSGSLALYSNGTFDSTVSSTRWSGKYTLNDKGTSVKISGTVGGAGPLVGSIDNNFKMTLAFNTKGSGADLGQTTRGSVVSKKFTANPTQSSGSSSSGTGTGTSAQALSDFAGTYTIQVNWYLLQDNNTHGSDSGYVTVSSNGSVTQCSGFQILVSCTGSLTLNSTTKGASLNMSATSTVDGVRGTASITGEVTSSYTLTKGYVLVKDTSNKDIADGDVTGSKK